MSKQLIASALLAALAVGGLAACGEKPQTAQAAYKKSEDQAWKGPNTAFSAPGWQAGDQTSWQSQIRTRGQGQNDYARAN
ncbi:hypothetical protein [Caldimonas tepidiphila]|uniref:hypothetical protein n=1 Tax=Caldimonas tepidiphila TaxID=2315841 RepID=UPI00196A6998|nr:hypothetical protein [Caldimonas tepidiphila]